MATKSLSVALRNLRERGGWSRREVAEAAGLSEGAVRDYELGKRSPGFDALCRLAVALGEKVQFFASLADTSGAFKLPSKPKHVSCSVLGFGKWKGRRMNEVPNDYLSFLLREKPRLLKTGQLDEAFRVLQMRVATRELMTAEEALEKQEAMKGFDKARARAACEGDDLLRQAHESKMAKGGADFDPVFFGDLPPPGG